LIALWDGLFKQLRQPIAQVLLTRNDIADVCSLLEVLLLGSYEADAITLTQRTQYLNASNTFAELLSMGIIPIVNENDTLAVNVCSSYSVGCLSSGKVINGLGFRKSNSAITIPYLHLLPAWSMQIIYSL